MVWAGRGGAGPRALLLRYGFFLRYIGTAFSKYHTMIFRGEALYPASVPALVTFRRAPWNTKPRASKRNEICTLRGLYVASEEREHSIA